MTQKKKTEKKQKITKDSTIGEVASNYPEAAMVLMKYGMHCIGCHVAFHETVEQGALAHGIEECDIKKMVKEMNEVIEDKDA